MTNYFHVSILCIVLILNFFALPVCAQPNESRKPELIRDTGVAEGKDTAEDPEAKEQDPALAKRSINIGNYYLKQKNYAAAIGRYLEAIGYQSNSIQAYEALAQAYEKKGDITKAVSTYKTFIEKNPTSSAVPECRSRIDKLEKKSN